jgi:hypothetical protein
VLVVDETQAPKRDRAEPLSAPSWTRAAAGKPAEDDALATPREAAFAALRELLVRVSALRPVVIAVDDLQWGDDDSATLLRELLTGPDAPNVLFVATLRGAPRHVVTPFDSVESSSLDRRVIDVSPLTHRDAVGLARRLLGKRADGRDNSDEAERIAHEAAGNPFFLGELARYSAEHPDADASRSIGLKDVVLARVAALAPEPRALLELIAVIGQPVPQRVIFDASNLGAQAYPALRALRAANMVRIAGAKEADSIEPYHDRIRETVVSELAPAVLRARHKALADALEARPESEPGLKAEHLAGAGELAAAAKAALEAGAQSGSRVRLRALSAVVRSRDHLGRREGKREGRAARAHGARARVLRAQRRRGRDVYPSGGPGGRPDSLDRAATQRRSAVLHRRPPR